MQLAAHHLELVAVDVSRQAASLVRAASGTAVAARTKTSPTDVVTHTDLQSESMIRSELLSRCPGSTIYGEEFGDGAGTNRVGWIVDPIDGTVNFLYDLPVVAISIAATIDGAVVAGAVADVHRGEVFSAHVGGGARRDGEMITASAVQRLDQALVGTGFAYDAALRAEQGAVIGRVLPACRDIRCMGSAALNLCWVGCGRLDAYFERDLKVYDHAAGALIAAEGGAIVTGPGEGDLIMACGPGLDQQFRALVDRPPS